MRKTYLDQNNYELFINGLIEYLQFLEKNKTTHNTQILHSGMESFKEPLN